MRFPTLGDVENAHLFFDEDHADECISTQRAQHEPDKKDAVATMKGIFALAQAEQNDMIKDGWEIDFTDRSPISDQVVDQVVEKYRQFED